MKEVKVIRYQCESKLSHIHDTPEAAITCEKHQVCTHKNTLWDYATGMVTEIYQYCTFCFERLHEVNIECPKVMKEFNDRTTTYVPPDLTQSELEEFYNKAENARKRVSLD